MKWDWGFMGHEAWDEGFAISTAKGRAKKNRPSKFTVHDRKTAEPQSKISFEAGAPKRRKRSRESEG